MKLTGIIAYPITPFNACGERIDFAVLASCLEQLINAGSDAIAPLGSTGESAYLNQEEWEKVAAFTVDAVSKRVPVIVGISEITTSQAVKKAKYAESIGADAVMVIPVSYWKLTDQEIFDYYQEISNGISIPIMVYNNPATGGVDISPELLVKMFNEIDNVAMVKESTGDIQRMHKLFELSNGDLPFFNGSNPLALEALCAGASGWCTAAPNLLDRQPKNLYESVAKGNLAAAQTIFYQQLPMLRFIVSGNIPRAIKAGLKLKGIDAGVPRKPLHGSQPEEVALLQSLMTKARLG
ncbi:dihydrodipicolinate synthase family protein [Candidatus Nitrotoga sp. AM1P]|uniref:dihydrodipicolinate synthase family protein n=1 Tax=Candidatus Nitrotoga sp. AM1P TaxID=2559597 RepID=UPI0010B5A9AA|nr:dihydrodipicolinate synthase family protein [Candidatus Nitrotoga sp. AM1P]BBJ24388.1 dihydrodipicolinate synthase family protein [Candidatus Nitrotoga sp. AM1P]